MWDASGYFGRRAGVWEMEKQGRGGWRNGCKLQYPNKEL